MELGRSGTRATTPPSRSSRILWAQLLARIFEVLPLPCPVCPPLVGLPRPGHRREALVRPRSAPGLRPRSSRAHPGARVRSVPASRLGRLRHSGMSRPHRRLSARPIRPPSTAHRTILRAPIPMAPYPPSRFGCSTALPGPRGPRPHPICSRLQLLGLPEVPPQLAFLPRKRLGFPNLAHCMQQGIESMSLNPDAVVETWMFLAGDAQ